jgi:hypothetical protein
MEKIELEKLHHGVVLELFDEEIKKVLNNIEDENTVAKAERAITIKIAIKPDATRRTGEVKVQVSSTLAKTNPAETVVFFDRDKDGEFSAFEDNPGPELPGINEKDTVPFPRAANSEV